MKSTENSKEKKEVQKTSDEPVKTPCFSLSKVNKAGIFVAFLVLLLGIISLFTGSNNNSTAYEFKVPALSHPELNDQGNISGWTKEEEKTLSAKIKSPSRSLPIKIFTMSTCFTAGFLLILRSFQPGLNFRKGVCICLGGAILGTSVSLLFMGFQKGFSDNPFANIAVLVMISALGTIFLRNGFRIKGKNS